MYAGLQVIDAEMGRRKLLEDSPIASTNEDPVFFDTAQIPWWAWVKRFHLPEARACTLLCCLPCAVQLAAGMHLQLMASPPIVHHWYTVSTHACMAPLL